jgi:excisionase family DNA binding protein
MRLAVVGHQPAHLVGRKLDFVSWGTMKSPTIQEHRHGPLLSVEQAADYIGVRPGTLRNWLSARRITYVKVGRLTRLSSDTLNQFIAEHTVTSVEDLEP